jgi:hypothetical protein
LTPDPTGVATAILNHSPITGWRSLAERNLIIYIGAADVVLKAMKELHEKVLDHELETIGTEKKVQHDRVFDFSIVNSLAANRYGREVVHISSLVRDIAMSSRTTVI